MKNSTKTLQQNLQEKELQSIKKELQILKDVKNWRDIKNTCSINLNSLTDQKEIEEYLKKEIPDENLRNLWLGEITIKTFKRFKEFLKSKLVIKKI